MVVTVAAVCGFWVTNIVASTHDSACFVVLVHADLYHSRRPVACLLVPVPISPVSYLPSVQVPWLPFFQVRCFLCIARLLPAYGCIMRILSLFAQVYGNQVFLFYFLPLPYLPQTTCFRQFISIGESLFHATSYSGTISP